MSTLYRTTEPNGRIYDVWVKTTNLRTGWGQRARSIMVTDVVAGYTESQELGPDAYITDATSQCVERLELRRNL